MIERLLGPKYDAYLAFIRRQMIKDQVEARGVRDARVLAALDKVARHKFVPEDLVSRAYEDYPLPLGRGQTVSQPYIVALMSELAGLAGGEKVLEIGTGSGYQTAVLAELAAAVRTVELFPDLSASARARLEKQGYTNILYRCGDGAAGWPEEGPYDAIVVTCAPAAVPPALASQLKEGGRLVIPVGVEPQELLLGVKKNGELETRTAAQVRFVPMLAP